MRLELIAWRRAFGGVALFTSAAAAQRPVALVHGLGDGGGRWQSAQTRLQQEFGSQVTVSSHSYTTFEGIETWAGQVHGALPDSGPLPIVIGHSAGGLAARAADRRADRDLHGIITIGTPHGGAAIINNRAVAEGAILLAEVDLLAPVNLYWGAYGDFDSMVLGLDALVLLGSVATYWFEIRPPLVSATAPEIQLGAAYLGGAGGLNSAANLAREAAAMGDRRVSIVSQVAANRQLCASILWYFPDTCYTTFQLVGDAYYASYQYFSNYLDYEDPWMYNKRANAYIWIVGAVTLWHGLNTAWCLAIGDGACFGDGLIPTWSQSWPGALSTALPIGSAAHKVQPESFIAQDEIIARLRDRFGLF